MQKVSISPVDAVFAGGGYPIEFLLIFDEGIDTRRLRASIRALSRPFWPAFGSLAAAEISFDGYDETRHYDEVTAGADPDIRGSIAELTAAFSGYVPRDMPGLVFFRVIDLNGCSALLFRMSHAVGDGYSVFFLLSTLAAMSRFAAWPFSSRVIAALVRPHHLRRIAGARPIPAIQRAAPAPASPHRVEVERVTRTELNARLATVSHRDGPRISHNDLLSAMVLQRIAASQPARFRSSIRLSIPIDVRRDVRAYGPRFFGNGIYFHHVDLDARRVKTLAAEDLAAALRAERPTLDEATYLSFLDSLSEALREDAAPLEHPYDPARGCLLTNISRLPIQHLDFGRGWPSRVVPLTIAENSAAVLREGDDYVLRLVT